MNCRYVPATFLTTKHNHRTTIGCWLFNMPPCIFHTPFAQMHDPTAVMAAVEPKFFTATKTVYVDVEDQSQRCNGVCIPGKVSPPFHFCCAQTESVLRWTHTQIGKGTSNTRTHTTWILEYFGRLMQQGWKSFTWTQLLNLCQPTHKLYPTSKFWAWIKTACLHLRAIPFCASFGRK